MKNLLASILLVFVSDLLAQVENQALYDAISSNTAYITATQEHSAGVFIGTFKIEGEHPTDPSLLQTQTVNAVFQNNGDHYVMATNILYHKMALDVMMENGAIEDISERGVKKNASYERSSDTTLMITINKKYKGQKSGSISYQILDDLNWVHKSNSILSLVQQKAINGRIKTFTKASLTKVDNDELALLVDDESIIPYREEPDLEEAIGYWNWEFTSQGMSIHLYNYSDKFEFYVTAPFEEGENPDDWRADIEKFIKKSKFNSASTLEFTNFKDGKYGGVRITFKLDGSLSGDDFIAGYDDLYSFSNRLSKVFY